MNVIQEINRINQKELQQGITNTPSSWHNQYASSAWVYIGNLPLQLSEGDLLAVMSQWGEIEDINLVREESTGKSKGFAFLKYEDCKSCVLAVDNFNGIKILGRSLRVDHVENYRLPKYLREKEEQGALDDENDVKNINGEEVPKPVDDRGELKPGHAYHGKLFKNEFDIHQGQDLFAPPPTLAASTERGGYTNENDRNGAMSMQEDRKLAKLQRKAERDRIRREREIRRQEREERRRMKRAREMEHGSTTSNDQIVEGEKNDNKETSSKRRKKKKKDKLKRHSRHHGHQRRTEEKDHRSLSRSTDRSSSRSRSRSVSRDRSSLSRSDNRDNTRRRYDSE
mmetsp:Transcript_13636/g.25647  ORF Transcript_13636/g.25647 Transcript_13636/m.25647 type:complete len:340 (+) Transcript_13636:56-1075(+)